MTGALEVPKDPEGSYTDIPIKSAPEELADVRPGDRIMITAVFKVQSISEDRVCGHLTDIEVAEEAPPEEDDGDDEEETDEGDGDVTSTATPKKSKY
jgi:hypothetical protein